MRNTVQQRRTRGQQIIDRAVRSATARLESLETRRLLATTFYVDDSLVITKDRDTSGTLSTGDQVTYAFAEPGQTTKLTYNAAANVGDGDVGTAFNSINN